MACISCRTGSGKVETASGSSFCNTSATESASVPSLVAPNSSLTDIGAALSTSVVNFISGPGILVPVFRGNFGFPVHVTKDHGAGRFCATDVGRTRHYGRRNKLTGAGTKTDSITVWLRPNLRSGLLHFCFHPANQDGDVNRILSVNKLEQLAASEISLLSSEMAILTATYEKVARLFDGYRNSPGSCYRSNS